MSLAQTGIAAALLGVILFKTSFLADPFSLPKLGVLALGVCAAWLGLAAFRKEGEDIRKTPLDLPFVLLAAVLCVSTALSHDKPTSVFGYYESYVYGLLPVSLLIGLYYAAAFSNWARRPLPLIRLLVVAGAASALWALLSELPRGARAAGLSGSPVYLGSLLVVLSPFALLLARSKLDRDRTLFSLCGALIAAGLIATLSRGAWLAAACSLAAFLLLRGPRPRLPRRQIVLAAAALAGLAAAALLVGRYRTAADSGRFAVWRAAVRTTLRHPAFGYGPATFMSAFRRYRGEDAIAAYGLRHGQDSAHNDILQAAATTGAAGLAAYIWLLAALFLGLRSALREKDRELAAAAGAALLGLFVQAKFNPVPLPSMALAAALTGITLPPKGERIRRGGAVPWLAFTAAAMILLCAGRMLAADRYSKQARRALGQKLFGPAVYCFEAATRLVPWEMRYLIAYNQFLIKYSAKAGSPQQRIDMLKEAARLGQRAVDWHPNEAGSHHMLGLSLWAAGRAGAPKRLAAAKGALSRAAELDPYFLPILKARRLVLKDLGDTEGRRAVEARIEAVEKLDSRH